MRAAARRPLTLIETTGNAAIRCSRENRMSPFTAKIAGKRLYEDARQQAFTLADCPPQPAVARKKRVHVSNLGKVPKCPNPGRRHYCSRRFGAKSVGEQREGVRARTCQSGTKQCEEVHGSRSMKRLGLLSRRGSVSPRRQRRQRRPGEQCLRILDVPPPEILPHRFELGLQLLHAPLELSRVRHARRFAQRTEGRPLAAQPPLHLVQVAGLDDRP